MTWAMLNDAARCIGCRGCQVACKQWNDLEAEATRNHGGYENPGTLTSRTWTRIRFRERERDGRLSWVFSKVQCMHCLEPACVSVCTVGALQRSPEGPVVYAAERCIGCRYCQYACPFGVPKYEWHEALGLIRKCTLCIDRVGAGLRPVCAQTCPTRAIVFGERDELVAEAHRRIRAQPARYVDHVYGEHEVGGTGVLAIAPAEPEALGLPALGRAPATRYSESVVRSLPLALAATVASLTALHLFTHRRDRVRSEEGGS